MALRRIFLQIGTLAGGTAFLLTLWRALVDMQLDFFQASVRAVGAGIAVVFFAVLISGVVEKLGGTRH